MKNEIKKVIHKVSLVETVTRALLPFGAEVLYVDNQLGVPTLWYLFVPTKEHEEEPRTFRIYGTGHNIPLKEKYLGSCICTPFVWHVFEDRP